MEKLTLEQAVNRLDQILDNEKKLELKLTDLKKQVEKLNATIQANNLKKDELKTTIKTLLNE